MNVAGRMLLLSIAGLAHAYVTPKDKAFAAPEPAIDRSAAKV